MRRFASFPTPDEQKLAAHRLARGTAKAKGPLAVRIFVDRSRRHRLPAVTWCTAAFASQNIGSIPRIAG
jgi:hypothetical protein